MTEKYDQWFAQRHARRAQIKWRNRAMATAVTIGVAARWAMWITIRANP